MYVVFDEAARVAKPFYRVWSEGMVDEIEKGWIVKADSLEELAETIGVPAENLVKQVADYNACCEAGEDPLGRLPECLFPFGEGPYYAFPIVPCFINTQGGPVRNTKCQVLNTNREVTPGLFCAGELGSFYSDLHQGAGNIAECIMTGIDAVNTMMEQTADATPLVFSVTEKPTEVVTEPYEAPVYECGEGQYVGTGDGMSVVTARVTLEDGKIAQVEVLGGSETPRIGSLAIEQVPAAIVEAQGTEVDVVAGATRTSQGIIAAVKDALAQA